MFLDIEYLQYHGLIRHYLYNVDYLYRQSQFLLDFVHYLLCYIHYLLLCWILLYIVL